MRAAWEKHTRIYVAEQFAARHPSLVNLLEHASSRGAAASGMSTWILDFDAALIKSQQAFYEGNRKAPTFLGLQMAEELHKFAIPIVA